jgi:multidrug efflux pump subunit AcrA (membrane-fusion protein)
MKLALRLGLGAVVVMVAALVVVVVGWTRTSSAAPAVSPGESPAPAAVTTVHPERQTVRQTVEHPGQIEGFEQTPLYAKVAGYVQKYYVDIGDRVKAGQLLAELSVPELAEELHQKEAAVTLARAQVDQAHRAAKAAEANLHKTEAGVDQAEASVTRAEAGYTHWRAEYDRVRRLVDRGALDQATHDSTFDQYKSAEAARGETKANVELTKAARAESAAQLDQAASAIKVAEAQLQSAEADRQRTAAMLTYTEIRAPFDGVVTKRNVDTGHLVQSSGSGGSGTSGGVPLFVVVRTDPLRVFVDVPEAVAGLVKDGMSARVRVQALQEQEFEGKVTRTSWALDNRTRTLRAQIDLPNKDGVLRPGMYASAVVTVERPAALTLPAAALIAQDDQPAVLRVEDGKAVRTPVKLGVRQGARVELIKKQTHPAQRGEPTPWDNFTGAEEIVVAGPSGLTDGQAVRVRPSEMAHTGQPMAQ